MPALYRKPRFPFRACFAESHTNILRAHVWAGQEELREASTQLQLVSAAAATFIDGKQMPIAALCYRKRCEAQADRRWVFTPNAWQYRGVEKSAFIQIQGHAAQWCAFQIACPLLEILNVNRFCVLLKTQHPILARLRIIVWQDNIDSLLRDERAIKHCLSSCTPAQQACA